jgi:hypothetical protein
MYTFVYVCNLSHKLTYIYLFIYVDRETIDTAGSGGDRRIGYKSLMFFFLSGYFFSKLMLLQPLYYLIPP